MKRILGLDIGTTSIGWALVNERDPKKNGDKSSIIKTGVRVVPLSTDEENNFSKGKSITTNSDRTLKRGMRRNLDRYKLRRDNLREVLFKNEIIKDDAILAESGKNSTFELWSLRSKAASQRISLEAFARVLFAINKKRGYKSNRKAKEEGDGSAIDGLQISKILHDEKLTPAQYALQLIDGGKKRFPDFYRSDLKQEFERVWGAQHKFYPNLLSEGFRIDLEGKTSKQSAVILEKAFGTVGKKLGGKKTEVQKFRYELRVKGLSEKLDLEELAVVFQEIKGQIASSSGYLGAMSDRSKKLYFRDQTIGQYLYEQIQSSPHTRLKNQVFYRQDYIDEFEKVWQVQSRFHNELTEELKKEVRDIVIFYQRKLKSQKGLIAFCEFERREIEQEGKKRLVGLRCCPKSSPIFQEFKIWQTLNNLEFRNLESRQKSRIQDIDEDAAIRRELYQELSIHGSRTNKQILKAVFADSENWELNYKDGIDGNRTVNRLYQAFHEIAEESGHQINLKRKSKHIKEDTIELLNFLGVKSDILDFESITELENIEESSAYRLWHLLYSYEGDDSISGNDLLIRLLEEKFAFKKEHAKILAEVVFTDDYGSLSAKAMRRISPFLKDGLRYDQACLAAGYNHSHSLTTEDRKSRPLDDFLDLLPKNSLRNPVVEKILNQLVNVVNAIITEYGKPDEIRVELARDLKKSAKERDQATKGIAEATRNHDRIRTILQEISPFNQGVRITRNDIIKYKLYEELEPLGFKTLYTNTYVSLEKLFSKEFDIEHIIPKARIFDDSFSNKTLSTRQFNLDKGNDTAIDFMEAKFGSDSKEVAAYIANLENLNSKGKIGRAKYNKLLTTKEKIKDGFIERDLRNTQYISRKAVELLFKICREVNTTTGKITHRLREDWQLIDVMKELNFLKYDALDGMTYTELTKDGKHLKLIKDWTKRNDHRHHAMDAIAVAFCKSGFVQYFNHLNARRNEDHKYHDDIKGIAERETTVNSKGNRLMNPPMPIKEMRDEVKKHLEGILISFKAKNKVLTRNKNKIRLKDGHHIQDTLTPRGQLHKETIYGKSKKRVVKFEKLNAGFDEEKLKTVARKDYREALLNRLKDCQGDPKKAFTGKNSLSKHPVKLSSSEEEVPEKVEVVYWEDQFTIRKEINSDNFKTEKLIDKVIDEGVKRILKVRLEESGNDPKKAFSDLEKNPIWLNEEKGIRLKRVTISGVSNAVPLHFRKDHFGNEIRGKGGQRIATNFVSTGSNHHLAVYQSKEGDFFDVVTSFSDAVKRKTMGLSVIPKDTDSFWDQIIEKGVTDESFLLSCPPKGLRLYQSFKQNEMFLFPHESWAELEITDEKNYAAISPFLYRVQKFSKVVYGNSSVRDYVFRHHLETQLIDNKMLKDLSYRSIKSLKGILGLTKVRINHLGKIVHTGEY